MSTELVTKSFAAQALAFPNRVDALLAEIDTVSGAKDLLDKASAMQHYADRLKSGIDVERPIALGVLKIKAKLGELLAAPSPKESGAKGGRGNKGSKPASDPFSAPTISAYRKLAAHKDRLEEYFESSEDVPTQTDFLQYLKGGPHVSNNSGNNEWYTPKRFIDSVRDVLGTIDLDPASNVIAQETVQATTFYDVESDGLSAEWHGRVFMNPPYARGLIGEFVDKLLAEYNSGRVNQAIVLVNNATESGWSQKLGSIANGLCHVAGRIKYDTPGGLESGSPLQGQVFWYLGEHAAEFVRVFAKHGGCWKR